jgi:hypothetical protein
MSSPFVPLNGSSEAARHPGNGFGRISSRDFILEMLIGLIASFRLARLRTAFDKAIQFVRVKAYDLFGDADRLEPSELHVAPDRPGTDVQFASYVLLLE